MFRATYYHFVTGQSSLSRIQIYRFRKRVVKNVRQRLFNRLKYYRILFDSIWFGVEYLTLPVKRENTKQKLDAACKKRKHKTKAMSVAHVTPTTTTTTITKEPKQIEEGDIISCSHHIWPFVVSVAFWPI